MMPKSGPNTLENIVEWFHRAKPSPTDNDGIVQIGCHFEEVSEMIAAMKGGDRMTQSLLTQAMLATHALALHMKSEKPSINVDAEPFLDACCDQVVTAAGSAVFLGLDFLGAAAEVDRSNWSKFENGNPVLNENGKIIKGKLYTPPNLTPFTEGKV